MKGAQVVDSYS